MACQTSSNNCSPCSVRGIKDTVSIVWCLVCKEGLCTTCREHHTSLRVLRSHELMPIDKVDKLPEVTETISEKCFEHDRKLEMFCSEHQEACCIRCVTNLHRSCSTVVPLDDIIRDVESSAAFNSIKDGFNALYFKLEKLFEVKKNSVDVYKHQANDIKKSIENKHNDVVKSLERLKEQTFSQIDKFETMNYADTNKILEKLNEQIKLMNGMKADLLQINEKGTKLQIFLSLKYFEEMLSKAEDRLNFMIEKGQLDVQELSFIPDREFEMHATYRSIGEANSHKKSINVICGYLGQSMQKDEVKLERDLDKIKLNKKTEMSLPKGSCVTNCVVVDKLSNAMLFTDYSDNKRLILFDGNGLLFRNIDMESNPFDITIVKEAIVAVTLPKVQKVIFVDFSSLTGNVTKHFDTVDECFGIDFCENRLAVSIKGYGIQLFNEDGVKLRTVPFVCSVLAFCKSNICHIQTGQSVLRCCNQYGEEQWKVKLPDPFGSFPSVTVDEFGLIYITNYTSHDVFVVSSDGSGKYRKLLQQSDQLWFVNGIFFNVKTQQLLVGTNRCISAVLYDIAE